MEAGRRPVGREDADGIGSKVAREVGVALRHGRADQRADLDAGRDHGFAKRDPVRDVRGQHHHVRLGGGEARHDAGPIGHAQRIIDPLDEDAGGIRGGRGCVGDGARVFVVRGHDREPQVRRGPAQQGRQLRGRERSRARSKIGAAGADTEDPRQAAPGHAVRHGARFPVDQACCIGRLAGRDGQVRGICPDDDIDTAGSEVGHDRRSVLPALEIMDVELDRPSRDAAVGVGEVDSDPYPGQFLGSQGRRIARQREDRADANRRRRARGNGHWRRRRHCGRA